MLSSRKKNHMFVSFKIFLRKNKNKSRLKKLLKDLTLSTWNEYSINVLIIWKMNPLVVPVTGVKFKLAFLHA